MSQMICVQELVKRYGQTVAVDGISFSVEEGELFGFLGPNGAGKTTAINVLCTLLRPTSGRASVNGFDVVAQPQAVRTSIGLIFQEPSLDTQLTALENLEFHARIYNLPRSVWLQGCESMLRMVDLWDRRHDLVKTFSGGMKRRLEIARGLLHRPRVLFLDEPTLGLDPQTREHIWRYLLQLRAQEGITLFLTTHYMDEAERCDRIAIIDRGKIVALDTPDRLKALVGGDVVRLQTQDNERAAEALRSGFGLEPVVEDGLLRLEVPRGETFVPQLLGGLPMAVHSISVQRPTLDDVFLKLTGHAIRDEEASVRDELKDRMRMMGRR